MLYRVIRRPPVATRPMFAFARRLVSGSLFSSSPAQDMSEIKSLVDVSLMFP